MSCTRCWGRTAPLVYLTWGKEAVAAATSLLVDCGQVAKTQTLPTQLVTIQNADQVYAELDKTS